MLAVEPAEQGYNASYIYCDEETMYIARDQMKLLEGRLPQKEDEVVVPALPAATAQALSLPCTVSFG